ncbi:hypothetical protein [Enterococcus sp. 5H]|uniref:hypothetical protein n=1 Tax=Enterococcus sp. 5H TaxID=1229490 RepID=UPI0023038770|nr:hypothetical protein [Enterococcus sp. 5H]MDA9471372.1 hypothetical protein [Enterococcus sp. 5H]
MKQLKQNNPKFKKTLLLISTLAIVLAVVGTWQWQTTNLSAAPKQENKSDAKEQPVEEKQPVQNDEVAAPINRAAQPMPLVSNEEGLTAEPKVFTMQQNAAFPAAGSSQTELNKLVTGLVIPQPGFGIAWDYVTEAGEPVIPSSAEAGFQTIYVEITEMYNLTSIRVPIPVTVTNSDTTLLVSNKVALQTDMFNGQIILYPNETAGKSDNELKELIKAKSNAHAWDLSTGEPVETTVTATTTKNNAVGAYTATFSVDFEGTAGTTNKNVIVFGANIKSPYYFTVGIDFPADMGTNAANLFSGYRTVTSAIAANATYEWVTIDGEQTEPVNTFKSSEIGFHWGYVKMTDKANPQINTIIPLPITVTAPDQALTVDGKVGLSYNPTALSTAEIKGKTVPQIISLLTSKLSPKAWELTTGEDLAVRVTGSTISQAYRGVGDITVTITRGAETLTSVIKVLVAPDDVFAGEGIDEWKNIPLGSAEGTITNPINQSKMGFPGRGIDGATTNDGFIIRDSDGKGYIFSAGNGRIADIPGVGSTALYGDKAWSRNNGLGRNNFTQLTDKYFLRKGNSLKQILLDSANQIMYVYDLSLARNLNFSIELKMYNLQTGARNFSMLESVDTDYLNDSVPIYSLGNNSGFYMQPNASKRFTIRLKDAQGNWLSDYTKYIAGAYGNIGVSAGTNYFGNDFAKTGTEVQNIAAGVPIATGVDTAYQLGAPWKSIPQDSALKTGYQVFAGNELPYMQLKATPETWNIYQDDSRSSFETDYTLSEIPTATDYGTVYVTYPNGQEATMPFTSTANKTATGHLSIPRDTLPSVLNDVSGSIKTYTTGMVAINEAPGPMQGLPSVDYTVNVKVYNLGATPIAQSIRKDATWTKTAASLVKDPIILPGHTAVYEFVDGTPDTSKAGLQYIKVRMTDSDEPTQTKIIEVPLNVTTVVPPTTGLTVAANDFTIRKSGLTNATEEQIKQMILKNSNAIGWDNTTGLTTDITLSVTATTLTPMSDSGTYTATIRATKGSTTAQTTINITVGSGLDAIGVLQNVTLGTGAEHWTAARLKTAVNQVRVDDTEITDYSVTLLEAPTTKRITKAPEPTVPMLVKVTDNQNPSNTVEVEVPVMVTWGNAIAFGGSNTNVNTPNAQSSFALSIHEDSAGTPRLVSGYGNLPKANEGTPLSSAMGAQPYYQITHYDLSAQGTGVNNAKEVTDGPNIAGDVTFQGLGTNTPAQLVDTFGTDGQLAVNYGDILRLYVKDGQRALYTNNIGPTELLGGVPNDETIFVVVTKTGFVPLYFNQLDAKDISISSELTSTQTGYDDSYPSISSYFTLPNGVPGTNYTRVTSAGFKTYPKLNLAVGEEDTGSVYVTESTTTTSDKYLKYAYDVTFIGSGPELQIVEPLAPLSFGTQKIKSHTQEIKRTDPNWGFTVLDSRLVKNGWVIQAKMENPFETGSEGNVKELKGAALQLKQTGSNLTLNEDFQTIYQKDTPSANNLVSWNVDEGFFLQVPSGAIDKDATYSSRVDMILTNAPTE